jgi:hypothetical protein
VHQPTTRVDSSQSEARFATSLILLLRAACICTTWVGYLVQCILETPRTRPTGQKLSQVRPPLPGASTLVPLVTSKNE